VTKGELTHGVAASGVVRIRGEGDHGSENGAADFLRKNREKEKRGEEAAIRGRMRGGGGGERGGEKGESYSGGAED